MAVMQVRVVDMPVDQPAMPVGVAMRLRADSIRMVVLVVLVVNMQVVVLHGLVLMEVQVAFRKMQPQANSHERATDEEGQRHLIAQHEDRGGSADERSEGVVCPRPRGSQVSEREHEQHEGDPVAQEANHSCCCNQLGWRDLRT